MPLPGSGQLSINDIATEFSVTLTDVALNATLGTYASKSAGATTAISDFYGLSALTAYTGGTLESTGNAACEIEEPENTYYHNGSGSEPAVSDTVYTNSSGTTTIGAGHHLFVNSEETRQAIQTNSSGVITGITDCR
tara:strand:+ start:177 stop:587 length:411 start_codon:yes stop_codon:yes gene_type:complete